MLKICTICGKRKRTSSFYKRKTSKYGFRKECKDCVRERAKKFYHTHPNKYTNDRSTRWRNTPYGNWSTYKSGAKKRGLYFGLGVGYFIQITNTKCYYCGEELKYNGKFRPGVDRKDNSKGYHLANCVPSCRICNKMKLNLDEGTFIDRCKKIVKHQYKK